MKISTGRKKEITSLNGGYPEQQGKVTSVGLFTKEGKEYDEVRAKLAAIGLSWFNECQSQRVRQERQWYLNLAFYSGNHYVEFRSTSAGQFDLYVPAAPRHRVRMMINQVRKVVRKEISRLTAQKPNAFVVPSSSEDADAFAAQAGEQIWDSLWRELHLNRVLRKAVFWQTVCGNGFIKTYWDSSKIDQGSSKEGEAPVYGTICVETVTPFHIFVPDLLEEDIEAQPYVIHAQTKTNSWVHQNLGIDSSNHKLDSVDDQLFTVLGISRNDSKKDQTTVLEIWVKPGYLPDLPNGGMFTIAGGKIVQGFDQWPYEHSQYPFAKLEATLTGKFYNSSIIEDLIPLQRELNRTRSQLIEAKNKMAKPQLIAPKGSVDAKKITTEPGLVIEYQQGFEPPQPLPLQNIPTYVTEEVNRIYSDIADIGGQHEVSNGSTPPGVTAATAISFLQEQDESLISANYSSIEEAVEKVAAHSLMFVKMYWDEERTVKVVGLEGNFDVQTFKNADLRGNTDIRVEGGSALPTSRAAKQAFIMDLMKMGFIPPEKGLEMMEIGGINRIYEEIQIDKRQAQRENLKMRIITEEDIAAHQQEWAQQNPELTKDVDGGLNLDPPLLVPVHTYDNHELHIEVHNNYRKSQAFESASPTTQALFEEHVRMHQEALAGMMVHPLTGMDGTNPNAPEVGEEEAAEAEMMEGEGSGETTGPKPMPEMSEEMPEM
jgi:hypothetical protein